MAEDNRDVWDRVEHRYADSGGVKIHYAALGQRPLVVMIHGFPDFWYSWRKQMQALADYGHRTAAVDLRGYNLSDKPKGLENYAMPLLVGDIAAVVKAENAERAVIVGHDWGGFQKPDAHKAISVQRLAQWVTDPAARERYVQAFRQSDFEAMLNYYKANYPKPDAPPPPADFTFPKVRAPVLMFHGLNDAALLPGALNGTWQWVEKDLTLMTIPGSEPLRAARRGGHSQQYHDRLAGPPQTVTRVSPACLQ